MRTIDISRILSPDLKSRNCARDLALYMSNTGEETVTVDFSNVKFATRSFMDEFYNLFLKDSVDRPYRVEITNLPEDINAILESVSRVRTKAKIIPSNIREKTFKNVDELLDYLISSHSSC